MLRISQRRNSSGINGLNAQPHQQHLGKLLLAQRVTIAGMVLGALLASGKLIFGWLGHSTAVMADGLENTVDLFGSGLVLYALFVATKPPDQQHPYGHGRSETIAGLAVGFVLAASGALICFESLRRLRSVTDVPHSFALWPMIASVVVKSTMTAGKLYYGRKLGSSALKADAWHDGVEILSGVVALGAVSLSLYDHEHFAAADHWGGFAVGLLVLVTALYVVRQTSDELMDVMPGADRIDRIRIVAMEVNGVLGIEKTFARKVGLQYHVELHVEVDPQMSVRDSHDVATTTRFLLRDRLDWISDVIVHIEPFNGQSPE